MTHYRVFKLSHDGHIVGCDEVEREADSEVLKLAETYPCDTEVWSGARRIGQVSRIAKTIDGPV